MNKRVFTASVIAAALFSARAGITRAAEDKEENEQKIELKEAPKAVRKTLKREAGDAKIKTVDKEKLKGKTVYEADVKIDGHNYEIVVSEKGLLLSKKLDEEEDEKSESKSVKKSSAKEEDDEKVEKSESKSAKKSSAREEDDDEKDSDKKVTKKDSTEKSEQKGEHEDKDDHAEKGK